MEPEESREQKLPAPNWIKTILIGAMTYALGLLSWQLFYSFSGKPVEYLWSDSWAILALPVTVVFILNPLLLLGLQKKAYSITQNPITQMELASAELNPVGFTKITRVWMIFILALILFYFVGRWWLS